MERIQGKREVSLALAFRPPFRWSAIAAFLAARAISGVESFDGVRYERAGISIEPNGSNALKMRGTRGQDVVARARRMFDLDADPIAIDTHLSRDPLLRRLLKKRPGPRVPGAWEPFEIAVRAIVGQQISVQAATTIMNRLFASGQFNDSALGGMPKSRIEAIRTLARAAGDDPSLLRRGATLDESIERLTALKGVGPWTAHYIAMRALREPDAFPHTDLGLRKAAIAVGIDPDKLLARAERWRPWRAYAAITLWESL
jgi:AraC family transcriptional regulator of adaptative response / DNA-3-methyladenine glycosylase II